MTTISNENFIEDFEHFTDLEDGGKWAVIGKFPIKYQSKNENP